MERQWQAIHHIVTDRCGNDNLARLCRLVNSGRDIHPIALQDPIFIDYIFNVDANSQMQSLRILLVWPALLSALDILSG
jgi:hypothetical protein